MSTAPRQEMSFYSDGEGVRVTSTRFIAGTTTYAMGNITSVKKSVVPPRVRGPLLFILVGAFALISTLRGRPSAGVIFLGTALVLLGGWWWSTLKPTYGVIIASSSGESTPLSSTDGSRIEKIIQAVNEAIIKRG